MVEKHTRKTWTGKEDGLPYDLEAARRYWRFAPSGKGKVDTSKLLKLSDEEFRETWSAHFESRLDYYWEDKYFVAFFCGLFYGKRVLSFGSGIGYNELQFLAANCELTCADIVQSNLEVIARAANMRRVRKPHLMHLVHPPTADFGGPYDYIFARGVMMHLPEVDQISVMRQFRKALKPEGLIIMNVYTRKFAERCPEPDNPVAFARVSDPSVGDCHNPWSEWFDDDKAMRISDLYIVHKQLWMDDLYCWYALGQRPAVATPFPLTLVRPTDGH